LPKSLCSYSTVNQKAAAAPTLHLAQQTAISSTLLAGENDENLPKAVQAEVLPVMACSTTCMHY
jgi:hypothetical protein